MKEYLSAVRSPIKRPITKKILHSVSILLAGVVIGVIAKIIDEIPSGVLPAIYDALNLRDFLSRIGIWMFAGSVISYFSSSPGRAVINTVLFLSGMIASYYVYTAVFMGFFPFTYVMMWIGFIVISPIMAFLCWYAKGKGVFAVAISSLIIYFMMRQAFTFDLWQVGLKNFFELILLIATIVLLFQSVKQMLAATLTATALCFVTHKLTFFGGWM